MTTPRRSSEVLPNPDPSLITNAAIDRESRSLEQRVFARIDGIEKAIEVQHADMVRAPTELARALQAQRDLFISDMKTFGASMGNLQKEVDGITNSAFITVSNLKDLVYSKIAELSSVTIEKFAGVNSQFEERDTRTDQRAGDTKLAVDAAFAAAKEATAKIEAGFTKQIESMADQIGTIVKNADDKVGDLKDRITAMESRTAGMQSQTTERRLDGGAMVGLIVAGMMAISVTISVLGYAALHTVPTVIVGKPTP
jgi:hypothetical protein